MVTTVKTMMTNRHVKLDAINPAGERHDLSYNKLRKNSGPFQSQTFLKLHVFLIDTFQCISYKEGSVGSVADATNFNFKSFFVERKE